MWTARISATWTRRCSRPSGTRSRSSSDPDWTTPNWSDNLQHVRATPTAVEQLTTTEAAVLALLAIEGERSAYELTALVAKAIADVWSPARSGLYAVLPRLVSDGLAQRRAVAQSSRPDKQLYRVTKAGRRALDAWFETVEPGARGRFFLKLFAGGLPDPEVLLDHDAQVQADPEA